MGRIEDAQAPNAMVTPGGDRFYPDGPTDAAHFANEHGAMPERPNEFWEWTKRWTGAMVTDLQEAIRRLIAERSERLDALKPPPPRAVFVLHSGYVRSKHDSDLHRVGCSELARLYGLQANEWISSTDTPGIGRFIPPGDRWRHLYPREDGNYSLPRSVSAMGNGMTFGESLQHLKNGQRVTRTGWNAPDQWVALQVPDEHSKMRRAYLYLSPVDCDLVPWAPTQTDVLAEDWEMAA